MVKHKRGELLPIHVVVRRMVGSICFGILLVALALGVGMLGYHGLEAKMTWIDAFLNASMILSGMGPVTTLTSDSAKLFAGLYALFSGLAFIAIMAVIFAPIIQRFLHKAHLDMND
jgi:hypothetical protein